MNIIAQKTINLMKNLYSLKDINKTLKELSETKEILNPEHNLILPDYYVEIFEESFSLLIELSILLRRECEKLKKLGVSVNSSVKYVNVAKVKDTSKDISFEEILSKIIHASRLTFIMKEPNGRVGNAFAISRNSYFTNAATIRTIDKLGNDFLIDIDLKKFCINAMQIGSELKIII